MKIFEILNVGQGDSIIMRPPKRCKYTGKTFIVDLGPGNYNITNHIGSNENIHIVLTHHDNDHMGGMNFFVGKMGQVETLIVPFYQNEITLIARTILNLKGISSSKDCNEFIKELESIVKNQVSIKTFLDNGMIHYLSFAYEGMNVCDHIECLNPPLAIESYDWIHEMDRDNLIQLMYELFTETFATEMEAYIRANVDGNNAVYKSEIRDYEHYWLRSREDYDISVEQYNKCNYVFAFIFKNMALLRMFNNKATRNNLRKIYSEYVKCTHDVCVVLKTSYEGETMLLTGDASKKVFNRLIKEGKDISATYLKVPHHGSKHNMSKKILDAIQPKVAIISHGNGHFGKSKDTHPNQEILDMLLHRGIKILITNDVQKGNITIMQKRKHCQDSYVEIQ